MEINGKDDHFARWLQGLCAIPLLCGIVVVIWLLKQTSPYNYRLRWELFGLLIFLNAVLAKCVWYALTGTGNINRDVMDETNVGGDRLAGDD